MKQMFLSFSSQTEAANVTVKANTNTAAPRYIWQMFAGSWEHAPPAVHLLQSREVILILLTLL